VTEPVPNAISSTLVRREWGAGRSVRYLVPDGVLAYLEQQQPQLYRPVKPGVC
jgi:nicotinic acid mononucleotide adenylyltransferase